MRKYLIPFKISEASECQKILEKIGLIEVMRDGGWYVGKAIPAQDAKFHKVGERMPFRRLFNFLVAAINASKASGNPLFYVWKLETGDAFLFQPSNEVGKAGYPVITHLNTAKTVNGVDGVCEASGDRSFEVIARTLGLDAKYSPIQTNTEFGNDTHHVKGGDVVLCTWTMEGSARLPFLNISVIRREWLTGDPATFDFAQWSRIRKERVVAENPTRKTLLQAMQETKRIQESAEDGAAAFVFVKRPNKFYTKKYTSIPT